MPATTANMKLPYPLPEDPIADGANQIKALAEKIDQSMVPLKIACIRCLVPIPDGKERRDIDYTMPKPENFTKIIGCYASYQFGDPIEGSKFIEMHCLMNVDNQVVISGTCKGYFATEKYLHVLIWGY